MPTLQQALVQHGPEYLSHFGSSMPKWHGRALVRLMACRTEEAGRLYHECATCGTWQMTPASCGHRACAQCGLHKAREWEARQQARLLPVPYVMVTFTVPSELRSLFRRHQKVCYNMLMEESGGTLREIAADPKHLGGEIGATGVLHTWKRDLGYHPHVHYLLPAGAWDASSQSWLRPKKADYFLPSAVLAVRLRNRFRDKLRAAHPDLWKSLLPGVWKPAWNVNVQFVGQGETAFGYLARYVQSTAIRNRRIANVTAKTVTYTWIDRQSQQPRQATLPGREFLRRFLQHVLPKGVVRVRHIGILSAAAKKTFQAVRTALGHASGNISGSPAAAASQTASPQAGLDNNETGAPAEPTAGKICCAKCQREMKFTEFRSAKKPRHPAGFDPAKRQEPAPRSPQRPDIETTAPTTPATPVRGPPQSAAI